MYPKYIKEFTVPIHSATDPGTGSCAHLDLITRSRLDCTSTLTLEEDKVSPFVINP
jgi:hypothetical protein